MSIQHAEAKCGDCSKKLQGEVTFASDNARSLSLVVFGPLLSLCEDHHYDAGAHDEVGPQHNKYAITRGRDFLCRVIVSSAAIEFIPQDIDPQIKSEVDRKRRQGL